MKVTVFHSSFEEFGGAERVACYIAKALKTKVYTILSPKIKSVVQNEFSELEIVDISRSLPLVTRIIRKISKDFDYLTWSSVDINDSVENCDAVITSGFVARALITPDDVIHVHYNHSPTRWLYDLWHHRRKSKGWFKRNILLPPVSEFLRIWDASIDKRVDYYFSNSPVTKRRLWKYLKRDSVVLYPPIEFNKYKCKESEDFYLFVGRLWQEKRPEEAIRGCIKAKKKIVVIGSGYLEKYLKDKYDKNQYLEIKGFVSEKEKINLLSRCKAVIYPCIAEDFGIVPIEAFASGKPIIADNSGFPPYVVNEERGVITDCSNPDNIAKAIEKIENKSYDSEKIREFAKQFDFSVFRERLKNQLKVWGDEFVNINSD